jgi:hypothetical protein
VTLDALAEAGVAGGAAIARGGAAAKLFEAANSQRHDRLDDIGFGDAQATAEVLLVGEDFEFAGG